MVLLDNVFDVSNTKNCLRSGHTRIKGSLLAQHETNLTTMKLSHMELAAFATPGGSLFPLRR